MIRKMSIKLWRSFRNNMLQKYFALCEINQNIFRKDFRKNLVKCNQQRARIEKEAYEYTFDREYKKELYVSEFVLPTLFPYSLTKRARKKA